MSMVYQVKNRTLKLIVGDVTALDVEAFVFNANHDLQLGSGFGTAITVRGGPKIQEELNELGPLETTQAVVSGAGELKAQFIVHAVGPRFQEEDIEKKLRQTLENSLRVAADRGIKKLAFPPMGAGFYGISLPVCAEVMVRTFADYLAGDTGIEEIIICALDRREYRPFEAQFGALGAGVKEAA
jgi:O-acetyl-ADP-ribose deacetylase (regulator of RNase III)